MRIRKAFVVMILAAGCAVQSAGPGQMVGIKVRERVREDDRVYREVPDK